MPSWHQEMHLLVFFLISCFTISVAASINRPGFSSNSTILITSSMSSFEMNKVNPFLTAPCSLIFLSNLYITYEAALIANISERSLANRTASSLFT